MWKTTIHAIGVDVDDLARTSIEQQVRSALAGLGVRNGHVHVRLYGDVDKSGLHTCHIRVQPASSEGMALGESAADIESAVTRAAARVATAIERMIESGQWPARRPIEAPGLRASEATRPPADERGRSDLTRRRHRDRWRGPGVDAGGSDTPEASR